MKQLNGMQNDVRYLRGRVDVNFYSDDSTDYILFQLNHQVNFLKTKTACRNARQGLYWSVKFIAENHSGFCKKEYCER